MTSPVRVSSAHRSAPPILIAVLAAGLLAAIPVSGAVSAPGAPCAACVTWRATSEAARPLLEGPGRLDGLDVLVTIDGGPPTAGAFAAARDLAARGATVGVELPLESPSDLTPLAGLLSRIVLRLPPGAVVDDALVFAVRTRATAARAAVSGVAVGLSGPPDAVGALAARGIAPYVSFLVTAQPARVPEEMGSAFEWWSPAAAVESVEDLLERTSTAAAQRLVIPLREHDAALARTVAAVADVLAPGLAPLATVKICEERATACATPVFIHPRTLDAVALASGGGRLAVRPGATRAYGRSLLDGRELVLPLISRAGETEVDARALTGAFVLRLAGWAGGEAGFTAGVEVTAARPLSVAEILAAHQAAATSQASRLRTLVASGSTVLTFQVPGLAAPMNVTADTILYRRGAVGEIEHRDLRLNGAPVAVGDDGVPRLPLVQPERGASPPLSITLGEAYLYRLDREEARSGQPCYVVAFEPRDIARPSYRGRAWITKEGFALVRMEATQTGLRGAIVSSRQEDEFRPVEVEGAPAWVLTRSDAEQVYEGPGHRTPIRRRIAFERIEANRPDFEARLHTARMSRSVMMRETPEGFRYLRRAPDSPEATSGAEGPIGDVAGIGAATTGGRALAGRASRVWSVAFGTLFDPNIDRPLPFAGLSYVDFDVLGTGAQMSALVAGPFAQVALSVPSVGGPGLQVQAWAFAALARYNDRSFRGGLERYDENLGQRPLRASVAAVQRLGPRARLRAAYDLDAVLLDRNETTAPGFRVPASPVAHGARLGLEWERGAWSATAWGSVAWRQQWREWGHAGDFSPQARGYERAGVSLTRSFVLSPAVVTRLEATALAGHDLDRFSRFGFDALDSRLRGYPSAGVRFDRGTVLRTAATWAARRGLRVGGFLDAAIVHDPTSGAGHNGHLGTGAALETALPGRFLLSVDWGFGFQARDREGRRGTHVLRVTAYKVL